MKLNFNGTQYDTETATLLAEYDDGRSNRDTSHMTEALYRTQDGEYFLFGQGGRTSCYARACPCGGWNNGSSILPVTLERAKGWAKEHLSTEECEAIFGKVLSNP